MQDLDMLGLNITEIKGNIKQISEMIKELTHLILTLIKMYCVKEPENNESIKEEVSPNIDIKNVDLPESNINEIKINKNKKKKKCSVKHSKNNFFSDSELKSVNLTVPEDKNKNLKKSKKESEFNDFDNIDLNKINFDFEDNGKDDENKIIIDKTSVKSSDNENKIDIDKTSVKSSDTESDLSNSSNFNLIKNTGDDTYSEYKTNFLYWTDTKQKVFDIYFNIQGYAGLDVYLGVEEKIDEKNSKYYIYFHCRRRKRIKIIDLEMATAVNIHCKKTNIKNLLKEKGKVFYDPLRVKEKFFN
jgi:hypothetical protein